MFGMQSFLATSLGLLVLYTFGDCSDVLKGSPTLLSFGWSSWDMQLIIIFFLEHIKISNLNKIKNPKGIVKLEIQIEKLGLEQLEVEKAELARKIAIEEIEELEMII